MGSCERGRGRANVAVRLDLALRPSCSGKHPRSILLEQTLYAAGGTRGREEGTRPARLPPRSGETDVFMNVALQASSIDDTCAKT